MKNPELFNKTISILVNAYFNNHLDPYDCAACAVGNLISGNLGYKFYDMDEFIDQNGHVIPARWQDAIICVKDIRNAYYVGACKKQIDCTGYTPLELALIEDAFLKNTNNNFLGLMNVCDCLMIIHEANETEVQEAKELFIRV